MKIRQKLVLLVVIPLVAVLAFAALAVVTTGSEALQADRLRSLVVSNAAAGDLVHALQSERSNAVRVLVADDGNSNADDYLNAAQATDREISNYRDARDELSNVPRAAAESLERVDNGLDTLEDLRQRTSNNEQTASAAAFAYRILIADLLAFRESVPQSGGAPPDVADRIRASTVLSQVAEQTSISDETVVRAIDRGELSDAAQQEITVASTGITEATLSFGTLAPADWLSWLEQTQNDSAMVSAQTLEDEAVRTSPGDELSVDPADWEEAMELRAEQLHSVQERVDQEVVDEITALRTEQLWWAGAQMVGVVVAVLIALVMAMRLGGPVVRGLRRLAVTAHSVATEGLPKAVARLEDHEVLGDRTPEEFAKAEVAPIEIRGKDELADVGKAFNEVHQEAIRVAAAQALLRLHIGGMFVRLARRGHSLAGRLTNVLDEAERNEDDPDRLERLFALDHLVTLFGRTNDSLLVLGGAAPARVRRTNETVTNVLTAAQSQIEQYTRVQIESTDDALSIKAAVVDDVVKLLAELLDNATEYSQHQVNMYARLLADRLIIQINDRGIGLRPEMLESLNARLASKSALDLNSVQTMGLTVVGYIAARHNIAVELRHAPTGGTLAEVSLPADLLEESNKPAELVAGENDSNAEPAKKKRRAPLFDKSRKGRNRRRKAGARPRPDRAAPVSDQQHSAAGERTTATSSEGAMGLPIVKFDMANTPSSGHNEQVDVPAKVPASRRRSALFNKDRQSEPKLPADPGWKAARTASSASPVVTDSQGLPKREPMAQLVPGSIETPTNETATVESNPAFRNPDSVSATYVAYARARAGAGRVQSPSPDSSRNTT